MQSMGGKRTNSQKPGSAPSKNRIRSQSPINVEGQGNNYQQNTGSSKNKAYSGNNKMISNTGAFGSMMTHGQAMHGTGNFGLS